ncbi:MAG: glycosyltransferase family 39 protein [Microgenomates group bacterium]
MRKFWKNWKRIFFLALGLFFLALILRLYNLTYLPVFADEAIYIRWSQVMVAEPTLRFLPLSDGKQPLFMWVLMFLVRRFKDPLFIGRLVSVATGIGTMAGIFALTYYLFKSKTTALIASLFWAISPFAIFFDRMALVDSMLAMFGIWTLVFGIITAKTLRLDAAMLTGFALGGALLTKSPALFFVILLPSTWLFSNWPKKNKDKAVRLIRLLGLFLVSLFIGYGMYNILRLGSNFHMIGLRNKDYVFPISHLWTNPKDPFISHFDRAIEWIWILGPSVLLIFIGLGAVVNLKKHWKETLLLALWGIGPIVVQSEFAKVFTARYIFFSLPYLFILAASVFVVRRENFRKIVILGLIIFIFHSLLVNRLLLTQVEAAPLPRIMRSGYLEEWTAGTGIYEAAELIREEYNREPDEKIVVGTEGFFGTLPDGLQIYLNDLPEITIIGVGINLGEVPSSLTNSVEAGSKTYLLINASRLKFKGEFEDHGLKIVAVYPKAFRPEGMKEFVVHGPRDTLYLFEVTEKVLVPRSS